MPSVHVLANRAVLRISGEDRVSFLQGLVSNDVGRVSETSSIHAAFLTAQGRYLHDFFLVGKGDDILLEIEADRLPDLVRRLTMYKLRAKVALEPTTLAVAIAWGDGVATALGLPETAGAAVVSGNHLALIDPRLAALGARLIGPLDEIATPPGLEPGRFEDWDRLRISLGVPDGSRDLVIEKSILLENGFDELNGVDWKKGCYIGQELTARTKYRGLVKKRLLPVTFDGEPPPSGTPIFLGGDEAGEMRSATEGLGLALLRLEPVDQTMLSGDALSAGETRLYPHKPDWLRV